MLETTRWQYHHGVTYPEQRIAPEAIWLDQTLRDRPQSAEIQLDLIGDYQTNIALYPKFQEFFRHHLPPTLAVWGGNRGRDSILPASRPKLGVRGAKTKPQLN